MKRVLAKLLRPVASSLTLALLVGCAPVPDDAPRHELALRDVLAATPEAVLQLPLEERLSLARRLADAMDEQRERGVVDTPSPRPTPAIVGGFDELRALRGDDAVIVVALESFDAEVEVRTIERDAPDGGLDPTPSRALRIEDEALRLQVDAAGAPAREWIDRLARDRDAGELVAAPSMPAGLAGDAERIHVNPVWLELLALLEGGDVGLASAALIDGPDRGPVLEHHTGSSGGFGCYRSMPSSCSLGWFGGMSSCSCGTCGFDCGPCATECGDDSDGIHCSTARREPPDGSPIDPLWLVAPVAYLAWRRRRA
ncbi:MAG: hypothetical protein M3Y87_35620 [Myxococcota bacterium]|nr:hypothetical protein [Myxococcota bacterium]